MASPFLQVPEADWIASNTEAFAIPDRFPVTTGHSLVVTRRIVPTWFEASAAEQAALMALVNVLKLMLDERLNPKPDGYNVGFNSGDAAGQTVPHLHVHVIPRYLGDTADPRGGIRHVIPEKGNYLKDLPSPKIASTTGNGLRLSTGFPKSPLWEHLSWRIAGARYVDVLASFVQLSGLDVIEERLFEAIRNEAQVRILVSDYLYISDPHALRRLMGWCDLAVEEFADERLRVKLIEMAKIPSAPASFHPKAWQIADDHTGFIAVGSSNLSRPALQTGIEWNLLSDKNSAPETHAQVAREFDALWKVASVLTPELVSRYSTLAAKFRGPNFEPEPLHVRELTFHARPWQVKALASLQKIRDAGYARALVAVATGMGKTWLAAFDVRQLGRHLKRRPRVLVIAHRAHILAQAEAAISLVLDKEFGEGKTAWCLGNRSGVSGDLVIASIQKLSRPEALDRIAVEHFDYVVMDEVHHAHAPSYRRVLAKLSGDFVLGLTATPERTDGVDVASIFDDNLAYHASIGDGIAEESLVPFHYIGIRDTINFDQIPWRNGRFDPAELEDRVIRSERMDRLWASMQLHPAKRTIVFCCSRRHAIFTRDWLRAKGLSSSAVFSGGGGDSYAESLQNLRAGELQTLCVVDMFNEGLDIPAVDRVIMLRPTESKVIFLQQLGRGLRACDGKSRLLVIDFVGNHRIFAQRMVHILSLHGATGNWSTLKSWLDGAAPQLPDGCLVDVELDAKDLIRQFIPTGPKEAIEGYRALRDELGRRPSVREVSGQGFLPRSISAAQGSWFGFAESEADLSNDERQILAQFGDWLKMLETTSLTKSYKMVVLRVLLDEGRIFTGVDLNEFAKSCRRFLQNHEVLRQDLLGDGHAVDHFLAADPKWTKWWNKWPIDRWTDLQPEKKWFIREGDDFRFTAVCDASLRPTFEAMTAELVDWRLAQYARKWKESSSNIDGSNFEAKVSHSAGKPILFVPDKTKCPNRPYGPTLVRLPDGSDWEFKFVKVACNVAAPQGQKSNQLGTLLHQWFGSNAGLPGTGFTVRFERRNETWFAVPQGMTKDVDRTVSDEHELARIQTVPEVKRTARFTTHVPVFDVTAAAGTWGPDGSPSEIGWVSVPDRKLEPSMFVAQVVGRSMLPRIPSGSWCLFRQCPAGTRNGRLLLIQVQTSLDPEDGGRYTIKRYTSQKQLSVDHLGNERVELQPLNPEFTSITLSAEDAVDLRVIGEFVCVLDES